MGSGIGRPPRPGAVKRMEGERSDRINFREPVPEQSGLDKDFAHFNDEQRALYEKKVRDLQHMGMAYLIDSERLVAYVYAEWMSQDCIRRINDTGLLVRSSNGEPKANPLIAVQERASSKATVLAREFGFTPSSRQSIRKDLTEPAPKQEPSHTGRTTKAPKASAGAKVTDLFA
jgi:P27 family predicted phage terminase small subunit